MLSSIFVTVVLVAALGYTLGSRRPNGLIARRPYNNRYNDASGARDERFGQ